MTPERLAEVRRHDAMHQRAGTNGPAIHSWNSRAITDLLAYVDELTRQRDDARDLAVRVGAFTSEHGSIRQCAYCTTELDGKYERQCDQHPGCDQCGGSNPGDRGCCNGDCPCHDLTPNPDGTWRKVGDPVGPVAWDAQVEQR